MPLRARPPSPKSEKHPDRVAATFEQGPFPAVAVPAFPPHMVDLFERLTGRKLDVRAMEAWERVRAFAGYEGVALDDRLRAAQVLEDPARASVPAVAAEAPRPRAVAPVPRAPAARPGKVDPTDLGD